MYSSLPTFHILTSLISHHSDTFANLRFNSAERTAMASHVPASWRVEKSGNYKNLGRSLS